MAGNKFERMEYKYKITREQQKKLLEMFPSTVMPDSYGLSEIFNLYYDTEDYRIIRSSIEKPVYKEKLRVRSYGRVDDNDLVFVELKKKYDGIVYKRRIEKTYGETLEYLKDSANTDSSQIGREIGYFLDFYQNLKPMMFIGYERIAYFDKNDNDFRVTFDQKIRYRQDKLTLSEDNTGTDLLEADEVLMEIKIMGAMPLWLAEALSQLKIYKASFSKYGNAYKQIVKSEQPSQKFTRKKIREGELSYA